MASPEERVLFVGVGGGNDVFSCLLVAQSLRDCGAFWTSFDVAGVLSPFHRHTVAETDIPGFFRTLPTSERFVVRNDGQRRINFVDRHVAKIAASDSDVTAVQGVYSLSLRDGTVGLAETFRQLAGRYQRIVLVDVGGDILYAGERDTHMLSPMFDAMTVKAFVDSGVAGDLILAGPGTDGELDPEALRESMSALGAFHRSGPISHRAMKRWTRLYRRYIEPQRPGNTVPALIEAFGSGEELISRHVTARAKLGDRRWDAGFTQRIDTALCKRYYVIDPCRIVNPLMVSCTSPTDWFVQTQQTRRVGSELSMQYDVDYESVLQFITPSPLFGADDRTDICNAALHDLEAGITDAAIMHGEDWALVVGPRWHQTLEWSYRQPTLVHLRRKIAH